MKTRKFDNPCGYGINPETKIEDVINYAEKLESQIERLKKQKTKYSKINLYNAEHPARKKAIYILEEIANFLGDEKIFDGENWYHLEDKLTRIIAGKTKE